MTDESLSKPADPRPTAESLRMRMLEKQMEEMSRRQKAQETKQKQRDAFTASFLVDHVSEDELALIRRVVMRAAEDGKFEAMVYSFPSDLCTDSGRAINSADPSWPSTLQGKAKALYERFKTVAQPAGYKLKATIINFPGGMPGDVGFFLTWEPDAD